MVKGNSAVIIGSGLGGLECGYILSRKGFKVTVLERDSQIGGCLQSFMRSDGHGGSFLFDTGFHCAGGLNPGGSLRPLFEYFGLMSLPWRQMDPQCTDEIVIGDESFSLASGYELFAEKLKERFPSDSKSISSYADLLKRVGNNIFRPFKQPGSPLNELFSQSAYEYIQDTFSDSLLRKVVCGPSLKMELRKDTLPLYIFAQINSSFVQSSWRLPGGGRSIASSLARSINSMGGEVRVNSPVTSILVEGNRANGVCLADGEQIAADWIISDAHPAATLAMIPECKAVRKSYRGRISSLPNTFGVFTANICLKPETVKYLDRNIFIHNRNADLWEPDSADTGSVMVHFYPPEGEGEYASHIDLMSPMPYSLLEPWKDLPIGKRGEEYETLKERKAEECIALASQRLPNLADSISALYTSTPLTYRSYIAVPEGSAFGVRKDWNNTIGTILSPRSPLENLLFTGASLNLHGLLGVSMTSVLTSSLIAGFDESLMSLL